MIRFLRKNQLGQTAVEYVLMLAVGASLGLTAFKKLNEYLLTRPDSVIGRPLNKLKERMTVQPGTKPYATAPFAVSKRF